MPACQLGCLHSRRHGWPWHACLSCQRAPPLAGHTAPQAAATRHIPGAVRSLKADAKQWYASLKPGEGGRPAGNPPIGYTTYIASMLPSGAGVVVTMANGGQLLHYTPDGGV